MHANCIHEAILQVTTLEQDCSSNTTILRKIISFIGHQMWWLLFSLSPYLQLASILSCCIFVTNDSAIAQKCSTWCPIARLCDVRDTNICRVFLKKRSYMCHFFGVSTDMFRLLFSTNCIPTDASNTVAEAYAMLFYIYFYMYNILWNKINVKCGLGGCFCISKCDEGIKSDGTQQPAKALPQKPLNKLS